MTKKVFANGNSLTAKSGSEKVIAAFPDVCLSPPSPPAGPIPIPYPNTSFAKDLKKGSKKVKVGNKPVALHGQSHYKTSPLGNEAATRSFGGSVITHQITGKTYFAAHVMDVLVEGRKVCRHIDLTTSNHASMPGSTPPNPNLGAMSVAADEGKTGKCKCCQGPQHSEGTATTFDEWYGLNEVDSGGNLTAKARGRRAMVEKVKNKKSHGCSCDGRVLPEAPCNVFRSPVKRSEHRRIVRLHDNNANRYRDAVGVPRFREFQAAFPEWSQEDLQKQVQINHLTPKNAGGCPTGEGNLQAHGQLCRLCKQFDDMFGSWQSEHSTIT